MKAISDFYGADEAAVMAILAGCDMLLMPEDFSPIPAEATLDTLPPSSSTARKSGYLAYCTVFVSISRI